MRAVEIFGGVLTVALALAAVMMFWRPGFLQSAERVTVTAAPALAQLALGGSATPFVPNTVTAPPPTNTSVPSVTPAPTKPSLTPTVLLSPQTGGAPSKPSRQSYTVLPGDSLLSIAAQFGVTVDQLIAANNMSGPNELIRAGQTMIVPSGDAPAAAQTEGGSVEQSGPTGEQPPVEGQVVGRVTHTVRPGDVLGAIAARYNRTPEELAALNGLGSINSVLSIGQALVVDPGSTITPLPPTATPVPPTRTAAPTKTPEPTSTPSPQPTAPPSPTAVALSTVVQPSRISGTAVVTQSAVAAPISLARHPAPVLLGVPDKMRVEGRLAPVLLNWMSVGILASDEYYVVRVSAVIDGQPKAEEAWVKATAWRLPETMLPTEKTTEPVTYTWQVTVRRATERGPDGQPVGGPAVSPSSQIFEFACSP